MKIQKGYILPSAAFTLSSKLIKQYKVFDKKPEVGDVVYGKVSRVGQHPNLENKYGRIHKINDGTRAIFVYGNRYAPDYYEALIPESTGKSVDLVARSGMIASVKEKNANIKDPTIIEILGYVVDQNDKVINTRNYPLIVPKEPKKNKKRSKLILLIGTSMNSGKSTAAAACCWALSNMGHNVRGSKVTGTASLKDILYMQDAGAEIISDFTHFGYPSTYMLEKEQLEEIFHLTDLRYANNPDNYWVVEIADGIFQRETSILLKSEMVRNRIHKLIFAATDASGAMGGVYALKNDFDLIPDALSGLITSSPLAIRELSNRIDIPIIDSSNPSLNQIKGILK